MKRLIFGLLVALFIGSVCFLGYRFVKYKEYDKTVSEKKAEIEKMEKQLSSEEDLEKEAKEKEKKIIEENKEKIEELEKWQKLAEDVKK